ncbi:MAG TPA: hypothetical protein VNJ08_15290 [Bacteriovoracaceae bacterium]|nr:hypothetical protein [Bacteriovoracaceae bacterium]
MITRKITYHGNFNSDAVSLMYDITRKTEITGEVKPIGPKEVQLNLEGDPAVIKLIQHQIDRKVKEFITDKIVTQMPIQHYRGVTLLS